MDFDEGNRKPEAFIAGVGETWYFGRASGRTMRGVLGTVLIDLDAKEEPQSDDAATRSGIRALEVLADVLAEITFTDQALTARRFRDSEQVWDECSLPLINRAGKAALAENAIGDAGRDAVRSFRDSPGDGGGDGAARDGGSVRVPPDRSPGAAG